MFIEKLSTGLDLGHDSIKIVQLKKTKEKISLVGFAMADLPGEEDKIIDTIKAVLKENKIRPGKINCIFSAVDTMLKEVKLPSISDKDLRKAVLWQAEKHISFSIDEAVVDYQIMGDGKKGERDFDGLLIISKKKDIEKEVNRLKSAGLLPVLVDIVPFALVKSYQRNYEISSKHMVALLEVSPRLSWLTVVNGKGLGLVRTLPIKSSLLDDFVNEIERSLSYCESKYFGEKVAKIILSGWGAKQSGFDKSLSQRLGIEVEIANPFNKLDIVPGNEGIKNFSPLFMSSVGLAL